MRRLGGSDIAKLLGVSSYGNAANVYMRVFGLGDDEKNVRTNRGEAFEPVLRAHGQNHFGLELQDTASDYHEHPSLEFAHAQIDDLAWWQGMPVCIDYKTQNIWAKGWGPDGSGLVPRSILAQVAWEMCCADRDLALLVVGFGVDVPAPDIFDISHVVTYQVQREPLFESHLVSVAREFWTAHVLPRVPPRMKPLGKKAKESWAKLQLAA